jgi:hypothetical protein
LSAKAGGVGLNLIGYDWHGGSHQNQANGTLPLQGITTCSLR